MWKKRRGFRPFLSLLVFVRWKTRPTVFTLALYTCNLGTQVRTVENPFNGTLIKVPIDPGLTDGERNAVRSFLAERGAGEPDPETYCSVKLRDGCIINVAIHTLDLPASCRGLTVECAALTDDSVGFVLELAKRGNMSIGSNIDPDVVAFTSAPSEQAMKRWPSAGVVETAAQLRVWLDENIRRGTIV